MVDVQHQINEIFKEAVSKKNSVLHFALFSPIQPLPPLETKQCYEILKKILKQAKGG